VGFNAYHQRHNLSVFTLQIWGIVTTLGAIATFAALFLFIRQNGFIVGLIYWILASAASMLAASFMMDGLRSVLALIAFALGIYLAFVA
jgi:hypothetical protein